MLICDPGDNSLEARGHAWRTRPRELPVHYQAQRPTLVLQPAGPFTITGAVVIVPAAGWPEVDEQRVVAEGMPDLSQDFNPDWPGLCGPTAAADVLHAMHHRQPVILAGFRRGPGKAADADVVKLIAGRDDAIAAESLAGLMGVGDGGAGATNTGIAEGLGRWLMNADPGAWRVTLEWFDDKPRDRDEQRAFFGRLAAAVEAGGGAVLCLWPGTEYADAPIAPEAGRDSGGQPVAADREEHRADDDIEGPPPTAVTAESAPSGRSGRGAGRTAAVPQLPEAGFPTLPPVAERRGALPGRGPQRPAGQVLKDGTRTLEAARRQLENGHAKAAYKTAAAAVAQLHEAAKLDPGARPHLDAAIALCAECDSRLPAREPQDLEKMTEYE